MSALVEIAVVGIDGAGKTSMIEALGARLDSLPVVCIKSRRRVLGRLVHEALGIDKDAENAGTVDPLDAAAFVTSVVLDMVEDSKQMTTLLEPGSIVLWDRHLRCFAAHGLTQGLPMHWVGRMEGIGPRPTQILWLDVPPETAMERLRARDGGPRETVDYLTRARDAYHLLNDGDASVTRLDGTRPTEELIAIAEPIVRASIQAVC